MLPAISPAVISHLAMPNSGVRRYAAALQSLVSAGARDRLARAEEPVLRRLCAGGRRIRTTGPSRVEYLCFDWFCRLEGWKKPVQKSPPLRGGPAVRIRLPPAASLLRRRGSGTGWGELSPGRQRAVGVRSRPGDSSPHPVP